MKPACRVLAAAAVFAGLDQPFVTISPDCTSAQMRTRLFARFGTVDGYQPFYTNCGSGWAKDSITGIRSPGASTTFGCSAWRAGTFPRV
jgi:hypothetical protein